MGRMSRKLWIDLTNSPHVVIFRPLIPLFEQRGYEVEVTARDFAQTTGLLDKYGIDHTLIGRHQGRSKIKKALGLAARSRALRKWARARGFSLAVSHGSNDLAVAAFRLGIPHVTMQDYEFNTASHRVNFRLANRILFPDVVDVETLESFGASVQKLVRYPGMKEEYYLHGFMPDEAVLDELGLDRRRIIVTLRTPPTLATYHRFENPLVDEVLTHLSRQENVTSVVLARTAEQRRAVESRALPNTIVPSEAVDGHGLVYFSDAVISAGGTINREAAVLGVPAYTLFKGRLGAVDQALVADGRVVRLTDPEDIRLAKRDVGTICTRDPGLLVDLILGSATGS